VDSGVRGIHKFSSSSDGYGFLCSDDRRDIYFARIDKNATEDTRRGSALPIEWSLETSRFAPEGLNSKMSIKGCLLEFACSTTSNIRVFIKTDNTGNWVLWKTLSIPDKVRTSDQIYLFTETLGEPPQKFREATWAQVRVEGVGATEIRLIELDYSPNTGKTGRTQSYVADNVEIDLFVTNNSPVSVRWL
jgi:hypothetical protein